MSSGGVVCAHLGFTSKELNDAANEEMKRLSHMFSGSPVSNVSAIGYAEEMAKVLPGSIKYVYFTNTRTESNEVAIQLARFHWEACGEVYKYKVVSLTRTYHCGCAFARSISGIGMNGLAHECPGIVCTPNYHCYRCPLGLEQSLS